MEKKMKKMIIINVEIPVELKTKTKMKAAEKHMTFKKFIAEALEEKIKKD